jgi:predicted nucleic acid-binding Zn ribbon protein
MREYSLEVPLLERRLIASWKDVMPAAEPYTESIEIRNQTLWVKISSPALKNDLLMQRTELTQLLNSKVGANIINDIRFF